MSVLAFENESATIHTFSFILGASWLSQQFARYQVRLSLFIHTEQNIADQKLLTI